MLELVDLGASFLILHEALLCKLIVRLHEGFVEGDKLLHLFESVRSRCRGCMLSRRHRCLPQVLVLLLKLEELLFALNLHLEECITGLV